MPIHLESILLGDNIHVSEIPNPAPVMELSIGPAIMLMGNDGMTNGFVPMNWGNTLVCSPKAVEELKRQCNPDVVYPHPHADRVGTLFGLKLVINRNMTPGQFMLVEETRIALGNGPSVLGIFEIDHSPAPVPVMAVKDKIKPETEQWLERWSKR